MDTKEIIKENIELKRKLEIARVWMQREIDVSKKTLIKENKTIFCPVWDLKKQEIDIINKIKSFLWENIIINIDYNIIESIISAEINYINLNRNPLFDGFSVIVSYHKSLDLIVENIISKWFRSFAKAKKANIQSSSSIDRFLFNVVNHWYSLSVWRLFHLIKIIRESSELHSYVSIFNDYLDTFLELRDLLIFDDSFFSIIQDLVDSWILWEKRHKWTINFVETRLYRKLFIWELVDKNCLIYKLLKLREII